MKREDIKSYDTLSNFKSAMKGMSCSCISKDTLDEAPFAYRIISELIDSIQETILIKQIIKPIYNFKAGN